MHRGACFFFFLEGCSSAQANPVRSPLVAVIISRPQHKHRERRSSEKRCSPLCNCSVSCLLAWPMHCIKSKRIHSIALSTHCLTFTSSAPPTPSRRRAPESGRRHSSIRSSKHPKAQERGGSSKAPKARKAAMAASLRAPYFDPDTNMRYDTNHADFEGGYAPCFLVCMYVMWLVRSRDVHPLEAPSRSFDPTHPICYGPRRVAD